MKFLFDIFPVALFFVAFKIWDIYIATGVAIGATLLQVGWLKWRGKHVDAMLWASLAIIVVFGGATLFLRNETFIKWKPTVLYWLFGAVLLGGELMRKNIVRMMLAAQLELPEPVWRGLSWSWIGFFAFMGAANLFVAYQFSTEQWVNFKLFGGIGLMLLFAFVQAMVLARYIEQKP